MKHINIIVQGLVQGVYFRKSTFAKAESLNIKGWVCNKPDGSVYIEAEGSPENINLLIKWCKIGPKLSRVDSVSTTEVPIENFAQFEIIG